MKNQITITEKLTKKIVSELIEKNDFLTIEVEGEWTLNKNAIVNDTITVRNNWKCIVEFFDGQNAWGEAAKFIMSKYSYQKSFGLKKLGDANYLPSVSVTHASIEEQIS